MNARRKQMPYCPLFLSFHLFSPFFFFWVYVFLDSLPWQGLKADNLKQRYQMIGDTKIQTPIHELCQGYPSAFASVCLGGG